MEEQTEEMPVVIGAILILVSFVLVAICCMVFYICSLARRMIKPLFP